MRLAWNMPSAAGCCIPFAKEVWLCYLVVGRKLCLLRTIQNPRTGASWASPTPYLIDEVTHWCTQSTDEILVCWLLYPLSRVIAARLVFSTNLSLLASSSIQLNVIYFTAPQYSFPYRCCYCQMLYFSQVVCYGPRYSSHRLQARLAAPPQSSTNTLIHSLDLAFSTRKLSAREEETY